MRRLLAIVTFSLLTTPAYAAANWVYVTSSVKDAHYYLDASSVRDQRSGLGGNVRLAWFKIDHSEDASVPQRESKILYHFKCSRSEMTMVQYVDYKPDGTVLDSGSMSTYSGFRVAVPDTVGYSLLSTVCGLEL